MISSSFIVPMTNLWIWGQMFVSLATYCANLVNLQALKGWLHGPVCCPAIVFGLMGRHGNRVSGCTTQQQKMTTTKLVVET